MLIELIVCDLVPLRERPKFMGVVFILFALGSGMGPFIGGVLVSCCRVYCYSSVTEVWTGSRCFLEMGILHQPSRCWSCTHHTVHLPTRQLQTHDVQGEYREIRLVW